MFARLAAQVCALTIGIAMIGSAQSARAFNLDHGVCRLNVEIDIPSGLELSADAVDDSPAYTMTVTGADIDPVTSGSQHCFYGGIPLARTTTVQVTPTTTTGDTVTCDLFMGLGEWDQQWSENTPVSRTDVPYTITGTWGSWVLEAQQGTAFITVVYLTFADPGDAPTLEDCAAGGVTELSLIGMQVF